MSVVAICGVGGRGEKTVVGLGEWEDSPSPAAVFSTTRGTV